MIGINTGGLFGDDDATRIRRFIDETGVTFPVVQDVGRRPAYSAGPAISPFPLDVVIDRSGTITFLSREYEADALEAAVAAALASEPP